ncbi:MAG: HD domain-containing protein [Thermoplasmatota archaeon]
MEDSSDFVYELGMLRRVRREGWRLAGVDRPESVAEHALRAAQLGYLLACMEGYERPDEVAAMLVFHDMGECRIGDVHKVANRYVQADEEAAVTEQCSRLGNAGERILALWRRFEAGGDPAGVIARDADLLEMAASAREYMATGYQGAERWLDAIEPRLSTGAGRRLFDGLLDTSPDAWWRGLKRL